LHTNSTHNTEDGTHITITRNKKNNYKEKIGKCGPCPVLASYTQAFALKLNKKHGKTSVRVVEKCPDIPVAVVQYTFTHNQCTEHKQAQNKNRARNNTVTKNGTYITIRILFICGP
jgi:hypothetical protein